MDHLARLLSAADDQYSSPLRLALFGTADPEAVAEFVGEFVTNTLGPVSAALFVRATVGLVVGCTLEDARDVVVKVHRWNVTSDRLAAVHQVQSQLADAGFPAPRPLVPPTPLGSGIATIEELRAGESADGLRPEVRRVVAVGLADFLEGANRIDPPVAVGSGFLAPSPEGPLWGEPHDLRFDFEASNAGAEWIDELAELARRELTQVALPDVIAHLDWRVENLGFSNGEIVAVYDWDSVGLAPEAVAVGQAAAMFSTDWRVGPTTVPSLPAMRAFVDDYEHHRGRAFNRDERVALDAANLMLCAYGARCQHSDRVLHPEIAGSSASGWVRLLRERGPAGLR